MDAPHSRTHQETAKKPDEERECVERRKQDYVRPSLTKRGEVSLSTLQSPGGDPDFDAF